MFRGEGAREARRYVVAICALLLAIWLFANAVSAGTTANSHSNAAAAPLALLQPAGKGQPFNCADIKKYGIDKQMNFHAMQIMAACSGAKPQSATYDFSLNALKTLNSLSKGNPPVYGGTDADVILPESTSYPHVTQSESMVWGHGNTVVVNYNDSRAASTCYGAYSSSTDGGDTWTRAGGSGASSLCQGHGNNYGDPIVVYNERLSMWFMGDLTTGCGGQGIGLWTSTDGITVTPGACAHSGSQDDRESMWVDNSPSSPYLGRMYISWNDFNVSAGALRVTYSDNGTTWSTPVNVTSSFIRNVQLTGGQDGTVFIASMDEGGGGFNTRQNVMQRSTDGGTTWAAIAMGDRFPAPGVALSGYFAMMFPTIWRHMGWGQPAVGPNHVVHYAYTQHGPGADAGDMMYVQSTDNGTTWSTPMQLNTDTSGRPNWQGSLAATTDGRLLASWYDGREVTSCGSPGQNTPCYRRYGRVSEDNGATWQVDDLIGDSMSPLPAQPDTAVHTTYEGDYDYSSANGNVIYTTWNDGRVLVNSTSQQDVFFDKIISGPTSTPTNTPSCAPNCTPTRTITRTPTVTPTTSILCGNYTPEAVVSATIVPGTDDTGNHGDDVVTNITLPFAIYLYNNQAYTSANVSSNGNLQFTTLSTAYANECLPSTTIAGPAIFPFWDDLRTDTAGGCTPGPCGIFTSISGSTPNRIFNIEWRTFYFSGSGSANFEIRLYENSPNFEFTWGNITGSYDSSTIGVQDGTSRYTQIACNTDITLYLNKRVPMNYIGCEPTRTPGRTFTPGQNTATPSPTRTLTRTPTLTPTPQRTITPCGQCNIDMLAVVNSCYLDGTVHWIAIVHNPDSCGLSAPWRAELQVRENGGNFRVVRIQYATSYFGSGDSIWDGFFCYHFSSNVRDVRVEYLFEDQARRSEGSNGNVQERAAEPNSYSNTPDNGIPTSEGGRIGPSVCDAGMVSVPMQPCERTDSCSTSPIGPMDKK